MVYAIVAKNFVILAKILVSFRRNLPVMFSSAQTPGRSLQDDTVELPFDYSLMLRYAINIGDFF